MSLPLVTIGICTKNNQKTVGRTIESIVNLDYDPNYLEIIIVDGMSQDKTLSIVKELLKNSNLKWRLFFDNGHGLGYARQQLVEKATGEFIAFVDADHYLHRLWLKEIVKALLSQSATAAVHGAQGLTPGLPLPATLENCIKSVQDQEVPIESDKKNFGIGCSLIRKKAIIQVGGFDSAFITAEDTDLAVRLSRANWSIINSKTAIFYHTSRQSWRALYIQYRGWGRGFALATKKHNGFFKKLSFFDLIVTYIFSPQGFKYMIKTFKSNRQIICIFMPLHYFYKYLAYSLGYLSVF
jgi:cellulose synthase/poly-beta-1,6-N-acetylglucosamine synthase-like glycosyltransferase